MALDISIIICTYNRERYLPEAITSLVEQDFDKDRFETIVVNNNSTDNTEKVCREFIAAIPDTCCIIIMKQNRALLQLVIKEQGMQMASFNFYG